MLKLDVLDERAFRPVLFLTKFNSASTLSLDLLSHSPAPLLGFLPLFLTLGALFKVIGLHIFLSL